MILSFCLRCMGGWWDPSKRLRRCSTIDWTLGILSSGALLQLNKVSRRATNGSGSQEMGSGLKIQI